MAADHVEDLVGVRHVHPRGEDTGPDVVLQHVGDAMGAVLGDDDLLAGLHEA